MRLSGEFRGSMVDEERGESEICKSSVGREGEKKDLNEGNKDEKSHCETEKLQVLVP